MNASGTVVGSQLRVFYGTPRNGSDDTVYVRPDDAVRKVEVAE